MAAQEISPLSLTSFRFVNNSFNTACHGPRSRGAVQAEAEDALDKDGNLKAKYERILDEDGDEADEFFEVTDEGIRRRNPAERR